MRTDGFPVQAGECGVCPQLLFEPRIADSGADTTYFRTREDLAAHGPSGIRSRSEMASSSTTQDSMGKEWIM